MLLIGLVSTATMARADDVVLHWNEIAARTVTVGQSPFHQARLMAITQLAVFEAVNAVTGEYESYLATPNCRPRRHFGGSCGDRGGTQGPQELLSAEHCNRHGPRKLAWRLFQTEQAKDNGIAVGEAAAAGDDRASCD